MSELELAEDKMNEAWREFYLRNPDIFIEQYFNVKLLWYQKILLKGMVKNAKQCKSCKYATTMCSRYCRKCR